MSQWILGNVYRSLVSVCLTLGVAECSFAQFTGDIAPPKTNYINRHWVNVSTNKIQPTVEDVAIGGNLGLKHIISTYSSDFANYLGASAPGIMGPKDNFRGGLYSFLLDKNEELYFEGELKWTYAINVVGPSHFSTFTVLDGGVLRPLSNHGDTLQFVDGENFTGYVYVDSDGTELYFPSQKSVNKMEDLSSTTIRASLTNIIYSNGLTVSIEVGSGSPTFGSALRSVETNTGFKLKYFYEEDTRAIPSAVEQPQSELAETVSIFSYWDQQQPKYVLGLNAAIDHCGDQVLSIGQCTFSREWPKATYQWPPGMPRAMYAMGTEFSVLDQAGLETVFELTPYEADFSLYPRITKITQSGTLIAEYQHEYRNFQTRQDSNASFSHVVGPPDLIGSSRAEDSIGYWVDYRSLYRDMRFGATGYPFNEAFQFDSDGMVWEVDLLSRKLIYTHGQSDSWRHPLQVNFVNREIYKIGEGEIIYQYDDRGNVTEKNDNGLIWTAHYPVDCDNRKTCNKPEWIEDPKVNRTDYTYHPQSGQLASITGPADKHGIRPQTRYQYVQKYAYYKRSGNQLEQADTPIWVLEKESYCRDSQYAGGSCAGGDEVVTNYEYSQENLFRIGMVVSADGKSLRTCFGYDVYGNQIAEYPPKATAGYSSCTSFQ